MQKEPIKPIIRRKSHLKLLFIILIIVFIIAGAGALFYFNIGGVDNYFLIQLSKVPLLKGIIHVEQPVSEVDKLKKLSDELLQKQKILQEKEANLNDKQRQLENFQIQLDKKESDLNNYKLQLDSKKTDLKTLATYYENMDPQNAANILGKITDDNYILSILSNMNKDSVSQILENMDPARAAAITKILINNAATTP